MKKIFPLLNHSFSLKQQAWADKHFGHCEPVTMPEYLKKLWEQVPPESEGLIPWLDPFRQWLDKEGRKGDLALIQGDFGATYLMVRYALDNGLVPVYATTRREAVEKSLADGTVKMEHLFRFCRFRKYGA